jgi:hypothetical protein
MNTRNAITWAANIGGAKTTCLGSGTTSTTIAGTRTRGTCLGDVLYRGLCKNCHDRLGRLVRLKRTTWLALEEAGLALASTSTGRKGVVGETPEQFSAAFWAKVDDSAGPDACWPWTGALFRPGPRGYGMNYGRIKRNRRTLHAHRVAWELAHGPTGELFVLHKCDNPPCCNPAHLFLGTAADNMADKVRKGRHRWGTTGRLERAK